MRNIEYNGITYRVEIEHDYYAGAPWENSDCHGVISKWTARNKKPGEIILSADRGIKLFYNIQESIIIAQGDGWGIANPDPTLTPAQITAMAVRADFEYLRAWCANEWQYCTICVFPRNADGDELRSKSQYLGGVEDSDPEYLNSVILELIAECEALS